MLVRVGACERASVRACGVRACVRACMRACVRACESSNVLMRGLLLVNIFEEGSKPCWNAKYLHGVHRSRMFLMPR